MTLNLELPQAIENQLIQEANLQGVSLDSYLVQLIKRTVQQPKTRKKITESALLKKINLNFSEAEWTDYKQLIALRRAGTINEQDYQRLLFFRRQTRIGKCRTV